MALFLLIILGIDWASGYAIAGYCMTHGVNPYAYAFWQSFGPFVLLLIIQTLRRDLWLGKSGAVYAVLCGVFGIVIPNLLIYFAAKHIPSGLLTVLANIAPIFTYPLALMFRDERFSFLRMGLIALGIAGVAMIILPSQHDLTQELGNAWLYLALLIPLSYAFSAVYLSRFHPGQGSVLNYALWMLMVSTLCVSILAVINRGYYELAFGDTNSLLIILEILLSTIGYVLLFFILRMVGSVYYSLVNAVAVITGVVYGYFIFGQQFSWLTIIAVMVILFAILVLTYTQKNRAGYRHTSE
ncbi:MAG: DMT family transporter [Neisseriaceae bacterium]|nr:MAG: DMT family transporter [Neisseriaceae bacterium]